MIPQNETPPITCDVLVNGDIVDSIECIGIEDSAGGLPSKAILRFGSNRDDFTGNITLNASPTALVWGDRITCQTREDTPRIMFHGQVLERQDQGSANSVIWTCHDDKHFLARISMRGAFVYDDSDKSVKFISAIDPHFNPNGFWNCVGVHNPVDDVLIPVFSSRAVLGLTYQPPDLTVPPVLAEGELVPWTPRLALEYIQFVSSIDASSGIPGLDSSTWRSLASSDRLTWERNSVIDLVGTDVPLAQDPLDRKLPDINVRGVRMLAALNTLLDAAGTHQLQLTYPANETYSVVGFQPVSYSALTSPGGNTPKVNLLRGGQVRTTDTLFDFDLNDDASQACEQAFVEGERIHVECSLMLSGQTSYPGDNIPSDAMVNGWSPAEEAAWLVGVNGGYGQIDPYDFAKYPPKQGATPPAADYGTWLKADGNFGRPLAFARSAAAEALLWGHFPYVYKAWRLDSTKLGTVLAGYLAPYSNTQKFPVLGYARPILATQLQFYLRNVTGNDSITNWLKGVYPVRLRVNEQGKTDWYDMPSSIHVRVSGDGYIWLDGISVELNNRLECVYTGDLETEPCDATYVSHSDGTLIKSRLRNLVLNCVVPMDHRVVGNASITPSPSIFARDYNLQLGGPPIHYVDAKDSFHETHQVGSEPGPITEFYTGATTTTSSPLNRILPPGSEASYAQYAAERKVFQQKLPNRTGVFRLVGIRPDFRAGMWVDKIISVNSINPADTDYTINAPIQSVFHDFVNQVSIIGGIANATQAPGTALGARDYPPTLGAIKTLLTRF